MQKCCVANTENISRILNECSSEKSEVKQLQANIIDMWVQKLSDRSKKGVKYLPVKSSTYWDNRTFLGSMGAKQN